MKFSKRAWEDKVYELKASETFSYFNLLLVHEFHMVHELGLLKHDIIHRVKDHTGTVLEEILCMKPLFSL
jgi:hypothetical protein